MRPPTALDGVLIVCWLALGSTIQTIGVHFGLYTVEHGSLAILVVIAFYGLAAPVLQKGLGRRSFAFAILLFAFATAIELVNAIWLHWWTFHEHIRTSLPNDLLLALIVSSPLFFIAYAISLSFRSILNSDATPGSLQFRVQRSAIDWHLLGYSGICVALFVAFGTYGNSDYILRPFGIGYLVSIAPLEPRMSPRVDTGTAIFIFAFQAGLIALALVVAGRMCSLKAETFGISLGKVPARLGVPLLVFLTVTPLVGFVRTGLGDPITGGNYPFVQPFSGIPTFVGYELAYLLFFFKVEVLFRSFLFLGTAAVLARTVSNTPNPDANVLVFAGVLSCLCYIIFHLGKPFPELMGSIVWGPLACAIIWWTRSVIYLVVPHWLWNVVLDGVATLNRYGSALS